MMNDPVAAAIRARRTIHDFVAGSAPPAALIQSAIEHAVLAPNHYLTRPWRFYLPGPQSVERICALNADLMRVARGAAAADAKLKRWREIPGWMVLTCVRSDDAVRQREDFAACCCAAQNFSLYLWEQGYGVKWTTGEITRHDAFLDIIGIAAGAEDVVGLFWFGRPKSEPAGARETGSIPLARLP
jgi:nitroreductase